MKLSHWRTKKSEKLIFEKLFFQKNHATEIGGNFFFWLPPEDLQKKFLQVDKHQNGKNKSLKYVEGEKQPFEISI